MFTLIGGTESLMDASPIGASFDGPMNSAWSTPLGERLEEQRQRPEVTLPAVDGDNVWSARNLILYSGMEDDLDALTFPSLWKRLCQF